MTLSTEEKQEIKSKIAKLSKLIAGIDKKLAPLRANDTPTSNIYYWYGENTPLGEMLRTKDKLGIRRHELEVKLGLWPI